jgi:hypothetical protein
MARRLHTIVETPAFLSAAKGVLSDEERAAVVDAIAANPAAGVSLGGGLRKLRIPLAGRGKSGGARVVLLFAGNDVPSFLLTVFAKNERSNLTAGEQAELAAFAKSMVATYRRRK